MRRLVSPIVSCSPLNWHWSNIPLWQPFYNKHLACLRFPLPDYRTKCDCHAPIFGGHIKLSLPWFPHKAKPPSDTLTYKKYVDLLVQDDDEVWRGIRSNLNRIICRSTPFFCQAGPNPIRSDATALFGALSQLILQGWVLSLRAYP